jgi:hypothetical protein
MVGLDELELEDMVDLGGSDEAGAGVLVAVALAAPERVGTSSSG